MVAPQLPMDPLALLPHRPPMLFVERLLERYGEKAIAEAIVPKDGICIEDGRLYAEYLIELIAQTAAMANGYDLLIAGKNFKEGMLVGIDSFALQRLPEPGRHLRIITEKAFEFGPVKLIHGVVSGGDEIICTGDIKVWEQAEKDDEK